MAAAFKPNNQHGEMVNNLLNDAQTVLSDPSGRQPCPQHPGFAASITYMANSLGDIASNEEKHHVAVKATLGALNDKVQKMLTELAVLKSKVAIYAVIFATLTSIIVSPIIVIALRAFIK